MPYTLRFAAFASAITLAGSSAEAAGWSTVEQSVPAMGAGGTGAARGDDPGANA